VLVVGEAVWVSGQAVHDDALEAVLKADELRVGTVGRRLGRGGGAVLAGGGDGHLGGGDGGDAGRGAAGVFSLGFSQHSVHTKHRMLKRTDRNKFFVKLIMRLLRQTYKKKDFFHLTHKTIR